jgi:UPF0271 protein
MAVDLNVDLGELPGEAEELYRLATVVNVACGGHAGDERSMRRALEQAVAAGTRVAAHPSYPDRANFGRQSIELPADALSDAIAEQCGALMRVAREVGGAVECMKPHGALYHDASAHPRIAAALLDGVARAIPAAIIVGAPTGALLDAARKRGLRYVREGFADRAYGADGKLVPRSKPGALIESPADAARQALELARRGEVETICVHSDTVGAVAIARAVREALACAGLLSERR